jgi:NAD(P)-dependent dehydrogenase (short-subunit alcohol dehydrogenase family)
MARGAPPVAIVTGAAHGIGRAIARYLLEDGWRVGVVDLPGSGLARTYAGHPRRTILIEGDVATEETAQRTVKAALRKFGRLDALVSNAGIMVRKPLRRLTLAEWHRVLDTNLTAAFLFARAAEKPLRSARGAIVTIASTRALMSEPNTESYSASKGGLVALTHALAITGELRQPRLDRHQPAQAAAPARSCAAPRRPGRAAAGRRRDGGLPARRQARGLRDRRPCRHRRRDDAEDDLRGLEHDPEKWIPVFGKDHAPPIS